MSGSYAFGSAPSRDNSGLQGRYFEQNYMGNTFSFGGISTALVSQNATATGLTATAQPIIGMYNPANSGKLLVLLKSMILITATAASTVSPAAFVWVTATGQTAISTGSAPISRIVGVPATFNAPTTVTKGFAFGTALTGLSGSLTNTAIPFNSTQLVAAEPATVTALMGGQSEETNDGDWVVGPGGFLGVMGTTSTTSVSVASRFIWCEINVASV